MAKHVVTQNKEKNREERKSKKGTTPPKSKKMGGILIWSCGIVMILAAAIWGLWLLSGEGKKPDDTLVFTVGSQEIYLDEVNFCILQNITGQGVTSQTLDDTTAEGGLDAETYYKQEILDLIVDYKVSYAMALKQGLELTEQDKDTVERDVTAYLAKVDNHILNQFGVTNETVIRVYQQRFLAKKFEEQVIQEVKVEEQPYCTMYLLLFPKVEMKPDGNYQVAEDGVSPIMLSDEMINQRKEDAHQALKELKDGADIEKVAQTYGVAAYSAQESNLAESFGEPFSQYAKSLKAGEYSPVLETASCYAVLKMIRENNAEFANQILDRYKQDLVKETLETKKIEWRQELGIGEEPLFEGKVWDKISLYDYVG